MENIKEPITTVKAQIDQPHFRTIVQTANHTIITDEPLAVGGADAGPSPQDLLLASLCGCTAITLRMYIDRKKWIVDHISVDAELFKTDSFPLIKLRLMIEEELSVEQRKRLIQIAEACPIHKLLTGKTVIETSLV